MINKTPEVFPAILNAIDLLLNRGMENIIAVNENVKEKELFIDAIISDFIPDNIVVQLERGQDYTKLQAIVPLIRGRTPIQGKTTAYLCEDSSCKKPITSLKELQSHLTKS